MTIESAREHAVDRERELARGGVGDVAVEEMGDDDAETARRRFRSKGAATQKTAQNGGLQHDRTDAVGDEQAFAHVRIGE